MSSPVFTVDATHGRIIRTVWPCLLILLAASILPRCEGTKKPLVADTPDPLWSSIIAAHSSGPISRTSAIRIAFARDVVIAGDVGKPVEGLLSVEPKIAGNTVFESTRELVFKPAEDLKPGSSYRFELRPNPRNQTVLDLPKSLESYQFIVQVQAAQFDLRFEGLSSRLDTDEMTLRGELLTADVEAAAKVEQLLTAQYAGSPPRIEWQHGNNPLAHRFVVTSLKRAAQDRELTIRWSGDAIGAPEKGSRAFTVPAEQSFVLTQATAVGDDLESERHIILYFSDALDARQDLRGLIRAGATPPRLRVEGNALHVYVSDKSKTEEQVVVDGAVRNQLGKALGTTATQTVVFEIANPQVRWVGNGVILPQSADGGIPLSVPFEAVNLRSVRVTAFAIYENNVPQFLQVNRLDGNRELGRVGRFLWRKTIRLASAEASANHAGRWTRFSLDLSELMSKHTGGLVRLNLSFGKRDITNECGAAAAATLEGSPADVETAEQADATMWDQIEYDYREGERLNWSERGDPCKAAYYYYGQNVRAGRNFIGSNLGLLAKRDQHGELLVAVTDLRSAEPLAGVKVSAFNFQNQVLNAATTSVNGLAKLSTKSAPSLVIAEKDGRRGYLKLAPGVALPVSHFDVGGEKVAAGIKATLYGERGVWRPGDDIHLTFVLQDSSQSLPAKHPVTVELFNPQQQLVQTLVNDKPVGNFYVFALRTSENAPTGDWTAKATLGGNTFTKTLKIETVMPNRLKVDLRMDALKAERIQGTIEAQWLTGAIAANLNADVKLRLTKAVTKFDKFEAFTFDDPARDFGSEPETLFEGELDAQGRATIDTKVSMERQAPGILNATLISRVFEPGGAFSINRESTTFSPYERYIGMKLPKGAGYNDALVADTTHTIEIASLSNAGKPVDVDDISIAVYKVDWRWWWDQTGESLAQYTANSHAHIVEQGRAKTAKGNGQWSFTVKYPQWGRYFIRACDAGGGHCTGETFYVDWPYWAGRPQEQNGPGATTLAIAADKSEYKVGETAHIDLPEGAIGRALLTIENGSRILDTRWLEVRDGSRRVDIPLTAAMAPNVYASLQLLQPHAGKQNDRPLRMLGIVPLKVSDPKTKLHPELTTAKEWQPEATVAVEVRERERRAMQYTLAIVDEGLLGLTNFKTPALHDHFFKREALGITTWDVFDEVVGGYGASLERLLALGGSDGTSADGERDKSRFPPVVKFIGPFTLAAGATAKHEVKLPQYVGAVRVMVVAGSDAAYGSAEATVSVRQALMILPTLPRVVGPEEEIAVPISVFVTDPGVKDVVVSMQVDNHFENVGGKNAILSFARPEEKLAMLRVKTTQRIGKSHVVFQAVSGTHKARAEIDIDVRSPNPPTVEVTSGVLLPGEKWSANIKPHGLAGSNAVTLEVSAVPPLNLESRLEYLIRYPYGCVEQTTSSVFPQLFITSLVQLDERRKREVEANIRAGIERLRDFQSVDGGFVYWPGGWIYAHGGVDPRYSWTTSYVGHFLVEANKLGYGVPVSMLNSWTKFQRNAAQSWTHSTHSNPLEQAYRLYTLALNNSADIGAMNRLRDIPSLSTAGRWLLAASYKLAGLSDAAESLAGTKNNGAEKIGEYRYPDDTFGSRLRDTAIVLHASVILGRKDTKSLIDAISADLTGPYWHSTQSVAYSLMAMAKVIGSSQVAASTFEQTVGGNTAKVTSPKALYRSELKSFPDAGGDIVLRNTSPHTLFVSAIVRGVPRAGDDKAANSGLTLDVAYSDVDGAAIDVNNLHSGTDIIARVTVTNTQVFEIKNIALTQMLPAGWEIHNDRMDGIAPAGERSQQRNEPWYWRYSRNDRKAEYVDVRDDRVYSFFALNPGESIDFITHINAAYVGRYYLPSVAVEAMYDASKYARTKGEWVEVVERKK